MPNYNRELSQFASFLNIDDGNKQIAITTDTIPFVGIGSTRPTEKLDVLGNIKTSGNITADSFYGDGSNLTGVAGVISGYFISTSSGIWTGASVGIGISSFSEKLNVGGSVIANRFISNVSQGTAPFQVVSNTLVTNLNAALLNGRNAPLGNIVGTTDTQTLTNKTLISPAISNIFNGTANITVPITSGTLIHTNAVGIITSGIYGLQSINDSHIAVGAGISYSKVNFSNSILNSDISIGAGISYSKLNLGNSIKSNDIDPNNRIQNNKLVNSSISGVSLGSNLNSLIPGNYLNGTNYNGSGEITFDVNATIESVPNTLVARDVLGDIYSSRLWLNTDSGGGGDIISYGGSDGQFGIFNFSTNNQTSRGTYFFLMNENLTGVDNMFAMYREPNSGARIVSCPRAGTTFFVNGTKNFKIDHPLNENKYLTHVSIEGPRADLIYRGSVSLVNGVAIVNLDQEYDLTPGTFKALCRNPQVWISNIDGWVQCRGKVDNEILTIEAREKNTNEEVNWMVIAERQDIAMYNPSSDENGRPILETDKQE